MTPALQVVGHPFLKYKTHYRCVGNPHRITPQKKILISCIRAINVQIIPAHSMAAAMVNLFIPVSAPDEECCPLFLQHDYFQTL